MMKQFAVYVAASLIVLTPVLIVPGCTKSTSSDDDLVGNWSISKDFENDARGEAILFTIGNKAYLGTGVSGTKRYNDLWEYDLDKDYWTRMKEVPGPVRNSAVAFAVGSIGYVGTGTDGYDEFNDMYSFNPATNDWDTLPPFPGSARYNAIGFAIGDKGYVGSGYDGSDLQDIYSYTPATGQWEQVKSMNRRRSASTVFVLNNKAYVVSGSNNGTALNDLLVYDPATKDWTEKRKLTNISDESYDDDYSSIVRYNAVSFVMGGKAYLATGQSGSYNATVWEYDAANDQWTRKTDFEGKAREGAVAMTLKDRGFVLTGRNGSEYYYNMYEWHPADEQNDDDNQ
ncbi:MAG: hypothetical protein J7621_21985 [Niastella sp.]|nr:hypothetical protein [Niastella sp.]